MQCKTCTYYESGNCEYWGGEIKENMPGWNQEYVTRGLDLPGTRIDIKHFSKW